MRWDCNAKGEPGDFTLNDKSNPSSGCKAITNTLLSASAPAASRNNATGGRRNLMTISDTRLFIALPVRR